MEAKRNEVLIQARQKLGLTQKQVASLVGITETSYQRYEYGLRKVSADTAILIARTLHSTVEELWGCNPAAN